MKILLISDSHFNNPNMRDLTNYYQGKVDLMVHCGDSSLPPDDPYMTPFDIVVKGNHDYYDYPKYVVKDGIVITHGHFYQIYYGYDELVKLAKENNCFVCFHGHTHVPTHEVIDGIHFINPGSTMINRGPYGYGTYAIVDISGHLVSVHYYHHETHEQVDDIVLPAGKVTIAEFKELIRDIERRMAENQS